jgi:DNA-binding winged helix-turn-helix (wHTH) protein
MMLLKLNDDTFYYPDTWEFIKGGKTILSLPSGDGFLFNALIENGINHPVSGDILAAELWKTGKNINHSGALKQRIYLLRQKLRIIQLDNIIVTISGRGYQIAPDVCRMNDIKNNKKNIARGIWKFIMRKFRFGN